MNFNLFILGGSGAINPLKAFGFERRLAGFPSLTMYMSLSKSRSKTIKKRT